jgi:PII-like signaling protein
MQGVYLTFFSTEFHKHDGRLLHEWLLEEAKNLGLPGGCAFRAIAGFGRHGVMHEDVFFELAGNLPVEIVFVLKPEQADQFIARLKEENLKLVYMKTAAEFGVVGE